MLVKASSFEKPFSTGDVLAGRYELVERLDEGGMDTVFRGHDQVYIQIGCMVILALFASFFIVSRISDPQLAPAVVEKPKKRNVLFWEGRGLSEKLLAALRSGQRVDVLQVEGAHLTMEDVSNIVSLSPSIVSLRHCTGLTDEAMKVLSASRLTGELKLDHSRGISPRGVSYLTGLQDLYYLSMRDCGLTDRHMREFGKLKRLRGLKLHDNWEITVMGVRCLPSDTVEARYLKRYRSARLLNEVPREIWIHGCSVAELSKEELRTLESELNLSLNTDPYGRECNKPLPAAPILEVPLLP